MLSFYMTSCKSGSSTDVELTVGKATLVFRALQEEFSVHIYKPIDNMYNPYYITDKIDIKPNISINYELEVNDFTFVKCHFTNGQHEDYLVFPGDWIELSCETQGIAISGSNMEGHKYFNDNYIHRGLGHYGDIIRKHFTLPINYDSVYYFFQQELILPYQTDLKKMELAGSISPRFSSVLAKNLFIGMSAYTLLSIYDDQILDSKPLIRDNFMLSEEDKQNVLLHLNMLYETLFAMNGDIHKMCYSSERFYRLKYLYLDDETKERLTEQGRNTEIFGGTIYFLLASDSFQLRHFGSNLIYDLQSVRPFFKYDQEKLFAHLNNQFPESEYVSILKKLMIKTQSTDVNDDMVILNESPSSIEEIMQIPGIKGKYTYIDLWATWCASCIEEFKHYNEIHKLLAQYNNIVTVFIAIKDNAEIWEDGVKKFNLKGYHILSSKSLDEDIGQKVYNAKEVDLIPRYLLLDPDGNIVNDHMPRPSSITELKQIFDGLQK